MSVEIAAMLKRMQDLPFAERKIRFAALLETHGVIETFASIYEAWGAFPPVSFLKSLRDFDLFPPHKTKQIKTIGIVTRHFGNGGIERVTEKQLELFRKMGIKCVFFTEKKYIPGETFPEMTDDITHIVLPAEQDCRKRAALLSRTIEKEQIDLLLFPFMSVLHFLMDSAVARIIHKIPCLLHFHNTALLYLWNSTAGRVLEKRALIQSCFNLNLVLSPFDAAYFNFSGAKSYYLPNPAYFPCVQRPVQPRRRKVLWLARMVDEKNPREAVQICRILAGKIPDVQVVMVGGGVCLEETVAEAQKLGMEDRITFTGADFDCRKYYLDADVFLTTSEVEGFPLTLVEALSAGLPIVAYELSYMPSHCDENKGIVTVPMYDTFAAADAIVKLLEDDEYYADMSRKALKQAEKYCNFDFETEWKKIFEAVCTDQVDSLIAPYVSQDKNFRTFLQNFFLYLPIGSDKLIQKIKDPLNTKIRELTAAQTEAGNRIAKQEAQITALNARVAELSQPWLKRKIKGGIRCLREHGFIYTVKRLFQKIGNKLCRK